MPFEVSQTGIDGLLIVQPQVFGDSRGYFLELHAEAALAEQGLTARFEQDNLSYSTKGTLRGLHFQRPPHAQGKLVCALQGSVLDVVVDIRQGSPTYGKAFSIELTEANRTMLYVPPGFAHGFSVLSDSALFFYKCTAPYNRASEGGLLWNDPALGIDWRVTDPILSDKDRENPTLAALVSEF